MAKYMILGIDIKDREKNATAVQDIFTKFGCSIKTRIGLHDVDSGICSPDGLVILQVMCEEEKCKKLMADLSELDGVNVQSMIF